MTLGRGDGRRSSRWSALGLALACAAAACPAAARARGIAIDSCSGCHGGGAIEPPELSMTSDPPSFAPGELVRLALDIQWPALRVGGVYVSTAGVGALQPLPGEGLAANGAALSHTAPKAAAGGAVTFRFTWRAPMTPGAVSFDVAAIAGNGNGASSGDSPGNASFQWVFGCPGRTLFLDLDRDGRGFGHQMDRGFGDDRNGPGRTLRGPAPGRS